MAEIDPEGQLELKKRARRRLVGAVALALLAIIVLPMVMDQEPKPLTQDIAIRIPNKDAGAFPAVPAPPAAEPKPAILPAKPLAQPPAAETKAEAKPEPKPEVQPEAPKPTPAPAAPPAKAPAPEPAAKPEVAQEQWILQLGAYQDQGNVKHLQAKVKELGYPSYTEKVDTPQGPRIRVRGGPFATREAAEKAQARLKKFGAGGPPGGVVAQKQ